MSSASVCHVVAPGATSRTLSRLPPERSPSRYSAAYSAARSGSCVGALPGGCSLSPSCDRETTTERGAGGAGPPLPLRGANITKARVPSPTAARAS